VASQRQEMGSSRTNMHAPWPAGGCAIASNAAGRGMAWGESQRRRSSGTPPLLVITGQCESVGAACHPFPFFLRGSRADSPNEYYLMNAFLGEGERGVELLPEWAHCAIASFPGGGSRHRPGVGGRGRTSTCSSPSPRPPNCECAVVDRSGSAMAELSHGGPRSRGSARPISEGQISWPSLLYPRAKVSAVEHHSPRWGDRMRNPAGRRLKRSYTRR
jgi:hypothetical protein